MKKQKINKNNIEGNNDANGVKKINPWFSMWLQPKKTTLAVIKSRSNKGFFYLAAIWFMQLYFYFNVGNIVVSNGILPQLIIFLILSPFIGAAVFYAFSYILFLIGKIFNGKGEFKNIKTAFAWSRVVYSIDLFAWLGIFIYISLAFPINGLSLYFLNFISILTFLWAFILLVFAMQAVQKISFFKTFLNVTIAYFFFGFIIWFLRFLFL